MSNNVSISMSAKDGDVIKAWDRIINQNERLIRRLEKTEKVTRQGKTETLNLSKAWGTMISPLKSAAAGVMSVGTAFAFVRAENAKLRREIDDASKSFDVLFRDIQIQTGLRGQDADDAKARVIEAAKETPLSDDPLQFAALASKQLASSGFSAEEATGESLRELLKVLAASALQDQPAETAQAIGQYLKSNNLEKNAKNLADAGRAVQKLFLTTDVQLSDLSALAKEAASFSTQMTMPEQLGAFSVLREVQQPEESATGLRNIVGRLSTASASNIKVDLLDQLGLKPEDVDFIGEDVLTVLERFKKGIDSVDETKRAPILKQLFEEKGVASARVLLENIDLIRERIDDMQNNAAFDETVSLAQSGPIAADRRQKIEDQTVKADMQDHQTALFNEIDAKLRQRGLNEWQISLFRAERDLLASTFLDRDAAAEATVPVNMGDVVQEAKYDLAERFGNDVDAKVRLSVPPKRTRENAVKNLQDRKKEEREKSGRQDVSMTEDLIPSQEVAVSETNKQVERIRETERIQQTATDPQLKMIMSKLASSIDEQNWLAKKRSFNFGQPQERPSMALSRERTAFS